MLRGEPYRVDDELRADHARAQRLVAAINATAGENPDARADLLAELLGSFGPRSEVRPPFWCEYGHTVHVGADVFLNTGVVVVDVVELRIGDGCQIGPGVQLLTPRHPLEAAPRRRGWESGAPVALQENVWLGGGVIVCPGVTIGADSVVGAGSVVTRDLPAGVLAVGNPCRVLRELPG